MFVGPKWTIRDDAYRESPSTGGTPRILIQAESGGYDDSPRYYRQYVEINGTAVLNSNAPRSYRATRITQSSTTGEFSYSSSNGYDVYGNSTNATNLNTFLGTFNDGDLLILNTNDEPNNNRTVFRDTLVNNFNAKLQYSGVWASRCSYLLIAFKNKSVMYESIEPRYSDSIRVSMWRY